MAAMQAGRFLLAEVRAVCLLITSQTLRGAVYRSANALNGLAHDIMCPNEL